MSLFSTLKHLPFYRSPEISETGRVEQKKVEKKIRETQKNEKGPRWIGVHKFYMANTHTQIVVPVYSLVDDLLYSPFFVIIPTTI